MAANVQSICQFWKSFNLQDLQGELDTTATELASRQDDSDFSRRRLVELSREFKKNTPEDVRKLVAPLLKSFQVEIDSLSKRSKAAEAIFLSVYGKIIDLPDPVPGLEHALQIQKKTHRIHDLELENKQLRETIDEYNHDFAEVKNQEVTIKHLREQLEEYENKLETNAAARAKEKEREVQRMFAEKERHLQDTQLNMAKKLGEAEHRSASMQSALDAAQSELFELKSKLEETSSARSDELDMVIADLDRANERADAAEKQLDSLKCQLATLQRTTTSSEARQQDMEQTIDILKCSGLEVELATKGKEIAQLVEDVQRLQNTVNKIRDSTSLQIAKLEEELSRKNTAFSLLEEKIKSQEDYEEIKRELEILKSIEFSNNSDVAISSGKTLEVLLLEKNKYLQNEMTKIKTSNADLTARHDHLQRQYTDLVNTSYAQKQLIVQLEEDLRSVNALSSMFRGQGEGEASGRQSTDAIAEVVKEVSLSCPAADHSAAGSLLPIVQSQRERFRIRASELEAQVIAGQQHVQMLQDEMDKLRSDNVKLYEKIKFLQSYPQQGRSYVPDDVTASRYSSEYEERLDPFSSFNKKERMRKYANLKPYDKITLSMGRFIMGNKVARTVAFFYTLILHMMIFLVLYKVAHTEDCRRDMAAQMCHTQFAEHMAKVHGDGHYERVHKE